MDSGDGDDCLTDLGFMFDSCHSRATKTISFSKFDVSLRLIDEDPGHVQSGQHLWPGAFYLSTYLCKLWEQGDILLESAPYIVELGAGCGLCGLVCAKLLELSSLDRDYNPDNAATIILTDYDPGSLSLLSENIVLNELNRESNDATAVALAVRPALQVESVQWGSDVMSLKGCDMGENPLVVGSDLIYCDDVIKPLFTTVHGILGGRGRFLLSFSFDIGLDGRAEIDCMLKALGMSKKVVDVSNDRNPVSSSVQPSSLCEAFASDSVGTYSATIIEFSYDSAVNIMNEEDRASIKVLRAEIGILKDAQNEKEQSVKALINKAPVDPNLLFFFGKGCSFTAKVEPNVAELEVSIGKRVLRLETWYDAENQKQYEAVGGPDSCGGVPFFYNKLTKESVCGARSLDLLQAWAGVKGGSK